MTTRNDVLKIAALARIRLNEEDVAKVQKRFDAILEHFKFLEEVDTTDVPPLFHGLDHMTLRPDHPEEALSPEALLQNAPEAFENSFRLPKVVGDIE